jgi:hypothetical protein
MAMVIVVVRAKVRERRQARQAKSKKKNRYVIKVKVMRFKQGRGWVPLALGSREPKDLQSLLIGL